MSNDFYPDWPHGHVTEDGRMARYLGKIERNDPFKYAFAVDVPDIGECIYAINAEGYCTSYGQRPDPLFLRNAPAPKRKFVRWVNMYEHTATVFTYETKEIADRDASARRTACVRVEFEEGEGL